MDNRSNFYKIRKIMGRLEGQKRVPIGKIKMLIFEEIGTSEVVVQKALSLMSELGYIKEVEHMIFDIKEGL